MVFSSRFRLFGACAQAIVNAAGGIGLRLLTIFMVTASVGMRRNIGW
jgi:hypothetical protein